MATEINLNGKFVLGKNIVIPTALDAVSMPIVPKQCFGVGTCGTSDTVSGWYRKENSAIISGTIYASPSGSPSGAGTQEDPLDFNTALRTNTASEILVSGTYLVDSINFRSTDTAGGKAKIVRAIGETTFRCPFDDVTALTWVDEGSDVWSTGLTLGNKAVRAVLDNSTTDKTGQPNTLKKFTSLATLQASTEGGYFHDFSAGVTSDLYIKYGESGTSIESIKSQFEIVTGDAASRAFIFGAKILFEGDIQFKGIYLYNLIQSGNEPTIAFQADKKSIFPNRPNIAYTVTHGVDANAGLFLAQNVWVHRTAGDNFHYVNTGSTVDIPACRAVEIDCISTFSGDVQGIPTAPNTSNGSAGHGLSYIIRVNGFYAYNYGPDIVDSGTGDTLMVGSLVECGTELTTNSYGIYANGANIDAYFCNVSGSVNGDLRALGSELNVFSCSYSTEVGTITQLNSIY